MYTVFLDSVTICVIIWKCSVFAGPQRYKINSIANLPSAKMCSYHGRIRLFVQVLWAHLLCGWAFGSELTFELPDNAKQCFYEDITVGTKCTLEFQVSYLRPSHYDMELWELILIIIPLLWDKVEY